MKIKKLKKPLFILLGVGLALVLVAVLLGVLNALVGGGEWSFGWTNYRYDDSGYSVGSGTVYAEELRAIDVDWIGGKVEVVICEDFYPSVSERLPSDASESAEMRYCISEDGTLLIKHRAPSAFFGNGAEEKHLIVRIPVRMLSQMQSLRIKTVSAEIVAKEISFADAVLESRSGDVTLRLGEEAEQATVKTVSGDVTLLTLDEPSFLLSYQGKKNKAPTLDVWCETVDGKYICGEGRTEISVNTETGELNVKKQN